MINGVNIRASGFNPGRDELRNYVEYVTTRVGEVDSIMVSLEDNNMVEIFWSKKNLPFERIRRITGAK